jgi:E-phenylitaconyl-CoA hydratase
MNCILFERTGKIAHIRLNRPDVMNAFSAQMLNEFNEALESFRTDDTLHVAIISGEGGRAFSTGRDLKDKTAPRPGLNISDAEYCDKPMIAAIRGYCIGQGLGVAVSCDLRVASTDAVFSLPEVPHGMVLTGLGALVVRTIGLQAALEFSLLGEKKDAVWALNAGLVHRLVEPGTELAVAETMAERLAGMDLSAMRVSKRALYKAAEASYKELLAFSEPLRQQVLDARKSSHG